MIVNPRLRVEHVDRHPGERRICVSCEIETLPDDPTIGMALREEATVSARDERDAPVFPSDLKVYLRDDVTLEHHGLIERTLKTDVHRVDLDVEQDWWRINEGGGFEPIAEFVDHLVAEVRLTLGDEIVATAITPTVTGSWGALGAD